MSETTRHKHHIVIRIRRVDNAARQHPLNLCGWVGLTRWKLGLEHVRSRLALAAAVRNRPLTPRILAPDLSARPRLLATALVVSLVVVAQLVWRSHDVGVTLGDTDDAMRLVLAREVMHGRDWYDQWVGRLQPPHGVYMHWSRLLDGALAAAMSALRLAVSPARAEFWVRYGWPLGWVFPVVLGGLAVARNVGARSAVFVCAILLALDQAMFVQFRPGRIDHHNIQIAMTVIAAACALVPGERRARWAVVAGATSALGLNIGIEALAFHALIGSSYGALLMADRRTAGEARSYGLTLAGASVVLFAAQTPPGRWFMPFCDAIGANLTLALIVGGLGLALVASLAERLSARGRIAAVALVGLLAAGLYLAADPACLHGPFGAVDPRVRPFWFDHIQELESWPKLFADHRDAAIHSMTIGAIATLAALWLLARGRRDPLRGDWLLAACALLGVVVEARAYRMEDYGLWFGAPAVAVALADLAAWLFKDRLAPVGLLALLLAPASVASGASLVLDRNWKPPPAPLDRCYDTARYAPLARLPIGVVLAEPNLGPFVLANTQDSVISAPYHRMTWGILAAHDALATPAEQAERAVGGLRVTYIVDCPVHGLRAPAGSLAVDLRRGNLPAWLQRLSSPGQPLQIYGVTPPRRERP
jgi:hypothetical protein